MDEVEQLLKKQTEWLQSVSREVMGKPGAFLKDVADRLQREGMTAARQRIEQLQTHRDALLRRIDAAIEAEKSVIGRLEAKIAEMQPDTAAASRAKATRAKKAARSPRKAKATTKKSTGVRAEGSAKKAPKPS